jgi:hypothetical protein
MTKQVTTTFSVTVRSLWQVGEAATNADLARLEKATTILDEEGNVIGFFLDTKDAQSCCTDHNRTTRQRAKQREHRKADAKSGHADHSEEDTDPDGETEETRVHPDRLANERKQQEENRKRGARK